MQIVQYDKLETKSNKLVVKHNKLIEFKGKMTVNELKLFSLIVADVREHQDDIYEKYDIDISILKETTDHKDFYNYIKEVAFRLEDKRIEVELIDKKGKRESYPIRLINRPRIVEHSKYLELFIVKDLIPYIIDLKREFTRYEIENILKLKSSYSVRLYELLKQYEAIGKRDVNLKDLREYLGIEKDEYLRFDNFESRVLKQAKREINGEKDKKGNIIYPGTDIEMDYDKIKQGRKIKSISFKIRPKDNNYKIYDKYLNEYYDIELLKAKMGVTNENWTRTQIMNIYEKAVEKVQDEFNVFEYIRLNYILTKERPSVRNTYAYLLNALEEDYAAARGQLRIFDMIKD